uniref:Uncharacterized protein n=1 Tax=Sinocyclocheilus anshuiensis TaxID=1608454 RepID=A0A671QEW1_9TELE
VLLDYCWRCCGTTANNCPSTAVLQNLLMCMVCFFSLYYLVVSLCIGILRVEEVDSLLAPFDYTTQQSWQSPKYLVSVISTEVTYVLAGENIHILHEDLRLNIFVMADFPPTEHWWIALGSGLLILIFGWQLLAYRLFRSNFVHPADLQNL